MAEILFYIAAGLAFLILGVIAPLLTIVGVLVLPLINKFMDNGLEPDPKKQDNLPRTITAFIISFFILVGLYTTFIFK